jgi:hypothetical protein
MAVVTFVLLSSFGNRRPRTMYITIPQEKFQENFADPSLRRFVQDPENQGASVVVREPLDKGNFPGLQNRVASLVENGLMRNTYNPRNRRLFENAMEKLADGSDYPTIREKTGTDLIFEIDFNMEEYTVSEYSSVIGGPKIPFTIRVDKKNVMHPVYTVYGFSIEIKVILLADNKIAGVYKYYQTPCTGGCTVATYDANRLTYYVPLHPEKTVSSEESSRVQTRWERYEKEISEFITDIVIPNMFAEMKGEAPVYQRPTPTVAAPRPQTPAPAPRPQTPAAPAPQPQPQAPAPRPEPTPSRRQTKEEQAKQAQEAREKQLAERKAKAEEQVRLAQEAERNAPPAQNTYEMAQSVSELIRQSILKQETKKHSDYKTDLARYRQLKAKEKEEISKYILSLASNAVKFEPVGDDQAAFFCKQTKANELSLLLFLNEECIGIGSRSKGFFTAIPKEKYDNGISAFSVWGNGEAALFNTPVNFSYKTEYTFAWNRNILEDAEKQAGQSQSSNSYEMVESISDLILQSIIKQEPKKHTNFTTDLERYLQLKDAKIEIDAYIKTLTAPVAEPAQTDEPTFLCNPSKDRESAILLFLDGKCIGIGTRNKGLLAKLPKDEYADGLHTYSICTAAGELLNAPVNFKFKQEYIFEWNRNAIKQIN